jgi:hypothetical protein
VAAQHRRWSVALAVAGYVVIGLVFSWPLPRHLRTHLPTPADGDTAVYLWNTWIFRHELLRHHHSPLWTDHVLVPAGPVDLLLHNYTIFSDLVALPLATPLGTIGAFNVTHLIMPPLASAMMFLLALHVTGRAGAAWIAGLVFGFSPFVIARGLGHFSLAGVAPLPLFALCVMRAMETAKTRYAAGAGAAMAWAGLNDPYYAIYCLLLAIALPLATALDIRRVPVAGRVRRAVSMLGASGALLFGVLTMAIALTGGGQLRLAGGSISARGLYTPVLVLTLSALAWLCARLQFRLPSPDASTVRRGVGLLAVGGFACALVLAPLVPAIVSRLWQGDSIAPPVLWRSSAPGMDLLAFVAPNPFSPIVGSATREWLAQLPNGAVENTASIPLTALGVLMLAMWRGMSFPRVWVRVAFGFGLLALGPFIHVAGANTYAPGPWALARFLPIVGAARMPGRLAIVVTLAVAVLCAAALARLLSTSRRPGLTLSVVTAALLVELSPLPRVVYPAEIPEVYAVVARDPGDVAVLEIPFGVRGGLSTVGDFSPASQFYQTVHQKRLLGAYLSRVPARVLREQMSYPTLRLLARLSEGGTVEPNLREAAREDVRYLLDRARIAYVVIDANRASTELRETAIEILGLEALDRADGLELYRPNFVAPNFVAATQGGNKSQKWD